MKFTQDSSDNDDTDICSVQSKEKLVQNENTINLHFTPALSELETPYLASLVQSDKKDSP